MHDQRPFPTPPIAFEKPTAAWPERTKSQTRTMKLSLLAITLGASAAQVLPYHGGLVVPNIEVTAIFYGNVPFATTVTNYYTQLTNSVYMDWLQEFNTPTQSIGRGRLLASFTETTNIKTHLVDSTDVHQYLVGLVQAGKIQPNLNSYYAIHFVSVIVPSGNGHNHLISSHGQQQGINIDYCYTVNGNQICGTTCSQYGAWHSFLEFSKYNISIPGVPYLYYGVMPNCGGGFEAVAVSHELIETITDPAGDNAAYAAWDDTNDTSGGEVADKCESTSSSSSTIKGPDGNTYTVATGWSNLLSKCVASNPAYGPAGSSSTTAGVSSKTVATSFMSTTKKTTTTMTLLSSSVSKTRHSSSRTTTTSKTGPPSGRCATYDESRCYNGSEYLCYYWSDNSLTWGVWYVGC
ncbi:hypothetical protein BC830DRAFT_854605 [Chytriomyces sp. MP71]|nr:hypothetical protein BC830DRAFT_854605 [Chytriomyces sp. MP71]